MKKQIGGNYFYRGNPASAPTPAAPGAGEGYRNVPTFSDTGKAVGQSSDQDELMAQAQQYASMSESDLMGQMFSVAKEEKSKGNLDDAKLDEFYRSATGMLSQDQLVKLRGLIDLLKDGKSGSDQS